MDFKEILYDYISENAYLDLIQDEAYQKAVANRRAAENDLTETLSGEQQELLEKFVTQLLYVGELESYFYFSEALSIIRGLLTA